MIHKNNTNQTNTENSNSRYSGFSLIELMVTIAIAGILIVVAIPSFVSFIKNARIQTESDKLFTALNQARQLAVTNNTKGLLCRTLDEFPRVGGMRCNTASASLRNWHDHSYMTYSIDVTNSVQRVRLLNRLAGNNTNSDNTRLSIDEIIVTGADREEQIQTYENLEDASSNVTINTNRTVNVIAFNSDGTLYNNAPIYFAICDERLEDFGKYIEISQSGRIRLAATTDTIVNTLTDCNP